MLAGANLETNVQAGRRPIAAELTNKTGLEKLTTAKTLTANSTNDRTLPVWLECVPNLSEGRDIGFLAEIEAEVKTQGVVVANSSRDADHHRTVFTWFGVDEALINAASRVLAMLRETRSLAGHSGVHPRTGLLDVVPFVPLQGFQQSDGSNDVGSNGTSSKDTGSKDTGSKVKSALTHSTMSAAIDCARDCASRLATDHDIPAFLYERAATSPDRTNLAVHRKRLTGAAADEGSQWPPDVGPAAAHPAAGRVLVGARRPLIAFNLDLESTNLTVAKRIASRIRASSKRPHKPGLPGVKALGLKLESRGRAQVSVNLTDTSSTTLPQLVERVVAEARSLGVEVYAAELIGLVTREAVDGASAQDLLLPRLDEDDFVEFHLDALGAETLEAETPRARLVTDAPR